MPELFQVVADPPLREPVLVVALEGWIDAGLGAAGAAAHLTNGRESTLVVAFDTDELLDHRSRRPVVHIEDGVNTGLTWPATELRHTTDAAGRDLLLLTGPEPDFRWRPFAADVVALAERYGVGLVVGLGAYPAPVPHTRPVRIATTATSADLAARAGQIRSTLDVPAGAQAAIEDRCRDAGLPAVGLWAQVPHYAAAMAYPGASAALVDAVAGLAHLDLGTEVLHEAAGLLRERLDQLVADNPEHVAMVRELEEHVDAEQDGGVISGVVPSGDELAAELEAFLRERGGEGPPS